MRQYIPAFLLTLTAFAPFPLAGCDMLAKLKGGGDAGADAEVSATIDAEVPVVVAEDAAAAPPSSLVTAAPTITPTAAPKAVTDAGAKADAAAIVDAAATADASVAPVPTPTFKIPPGLLDGGLRLLRPDGGALKVPWQR